MRISLCAAACLVISSGCIDRPVAAVSPGTSVEEQTEFPVVQNPDLDILFVIDNSFSMLAEQTSLATNFVRIAQALESLEDGLPNIHIGVVSTDVGAGSYACPGNGDNGILQNTPRVAGCSPPNGLYISNIDGTTNYSGTLEDTFSCIAQLGKDGCGFEQPLESMKRALDGSSPENAGFLRPNARLAVIIISDEDDCSATDPAMFERTGPAGTDLGPVKSFRCFEYGVTCDNGAPARAPGQRNSCAPRTDSPYMPDVSSYVSFLKGLKQFDSDILVAGIVGDTSPVLVTQDAQGDPCLMYSCGDVPVCNGADEQPAAVPPIRLQSFFEQFNNHYTATICDDDLSGEVQEIADWMKRSLKGRCIQGTLADQDPVAPGVQAECAIAEVRNPGGPDEHHRSLGECDNPGSPESSSNLPCYQLAENEAACAATPQHLEVEIYYPTNDVVPPDTMIHAYCAGE